MSKRRWRVDANQNKAGIGRGFQNHCEDLRPDIAVGEPWSRDRAARLVVAAHGACPGFHGGLPSLPLILKCKWLQKAINGADPSVIGSRGASFRNLKLFRIEGDKIRELEVYVGSLKGAHKRMGL